VILLIFINSAFKTVIAATVHAVVLLTVSYVVPRRLSVCLSVCLSDIHLSVTTMTLRYNAEFNVDGKLDCSQLNLAHIVGL